jgi:hypothetical protein
MLRRLGALALAAPFTLFALFTLAALVACKSESSSAQSGSPAASGATSPAAGSGRSASSASPVDAFCVRAFGGLVDQATKGCSEAERGQESVRNAVDFAREPLVECRRLAAAAQADRVAFDSAAAEKCLSTTTATKRVDSTWGGLAVADLDESPACDAVFSGKQTEGKPCGSTVDCKEPLTCIGATDEAKADGKCKAVPAHAGDPCDTVFLRVTDFKHRARCGEGLVCEPVADVCKAAIPVGGECTHSFECAHPAACRAGRCSTAAPADVGGACEDDTDDCKPGLYCSKHKGAGDGGKALGTCAEKKPAGASCTEDEPFECKGQCKRGEGKCVSLCGSG